MQYSLYKLFEHKCVLEVCVHIHSIMIHYEMLSEGRALSSDRNSCKCGERVAEGCWKTVNEHR